MKSNGSLCSSIAFKYSSVSFKMVFLFFRLKVLGMNAVFGYESRLQIGPSLIILTATCTGESI